jgi:hypothetical protein
MGPFNKQSNNKELDKLVEIVGQYSLIGDDETEEAVTLCREIGDPAIEALVKMMGRDIESRLDSENSHRSDNVAFVLGKVGKMSIPALSSALHISSYAHWALGMVARLTEDEDVKSEATQILFAEVISTDWMRVEAAVKGLGISKDKSALPVIQAARNSTSSYEIMTACDDAIERLS